MSWPFTLSRVNNLIRNVKRNNINKSPSVSFDLLRVFYIDTEKFVHFHHHHSMTEENSLRFPIEQLEQSIKHHVESDILSQLLINAKQLTDLIVHDQRFSKDYFQQIEKSLSHCHSNPLIHDLISLSKSFFEKYLFSSIHLRCYIQLHLPSNESGDNQRVNILKEIIEMETIIQTNENLFLDYYKKHYQILKYLNKYPLIEDFHLFLLEFERFFSKLMISFGRILNIFKCRDLNQSFR